MSIGGKAWNSGFPARGSREVEKSPVRRKRSLEIGGEEGACRRRRASPQHRIFRSYCRTSTAETPSRGLLLSLGSTSDYRRRVSILIRVVPFSLWGVNHKREAWVIQNFVYKYLFDTMNRSTSALEGNPLRKGSSE